MAPSAPGIRSMARSHFLRSRSSRGETTGVEVTTGPLAQGVATSVGSPTAAARVESGSRYGHGFQMAGREVQQAAGTAETARSTASSGRSRPGFELFGFDTFALASDGDMQEGLSSEAASLAGAVCRSAF